MGRRADKMVLSKDRWVGHDEIVCTVVFVRFNSLWIVCNTWLSSNKKSETKLTADVLKEDQSPQKARNYRLLIRLSSNIHVEEQQQICQTESISFAGQAPARLDRLSMPHTVRVVSVRVYLSQSACQCVPCQWASLGAAHARSNVRARVCVCVCV